MAKTSKKIKITERKASFVGRILDGLTPIESYREHWANGYSDTKARSVAKSILEEPSVKDYMQQQLIDRSSNVFVDEEFVIKHLRGVVLNDPFSNQAIKALELLGKYQAMWVNKEVIETTGGHKETAEAMFERRMMRDRGEEVKPLEDTADVTKVMEFEIYDGANGTD